MHELVYVAIVRFCSGGAGYQWFDNQIQWNPSMRTLLGPHESVLIIEVSTFQGF